MIDMKYIIMAAIMLISLYGCNQEEEVERGGTDGYVALSLNIPGATSGTRGIAPLNKESTIKNAYLFFYTAASTPTLALSFSSLAANGQWSQTVELPNLKKGTTYTVYTFANVPDSTISRHFTKDLMTIRKADLLKLTEELTTAQDYEGSSISFTSIQPTKTYNGGDPTLTIDLVRTVARVESKIEINLEDKDKWKVDSVKVLNEHKFAAYNSVGTRNEERISAYKAFIPNNVTDSIYYYVYDNAESANESDRLKLQIYISKNGTNEFRNYTATINKTGQGKIVRNNIYRSKIIIQEKVEPVVIDLVPTVWVNKAINVDVPYVYIDFPTDVYTLSGSGFGDFYFNSNADSIYADWSGMQDLYINSEKGPKGYLKPENGSKGLYKISCTMAAVDGTEAKGTISLSAGNITRSVGMQRPAASYLLMFDVDPLDKYTEAYTFDYTNSTTAKINIKVRRTQGAMWYGIYCIGYDNEEGIYKPVGAYAFFPMALPDNFDFELSRVLNYVKKYKKVYFAIRLGCGFVASGGVGTAGSGTLIKTCYFNIQK